MRKTISQDVQTTVLTLSRRRCALCYGLERDVQQKRGQIAHVDRNASNSALDNLVFLCLSHHDDYDSRPSQSKGYTEPELRQYRQELYDYFRSLQVVNPSANSDFAKYSPLIPSKWQHMYVNALEFDTATHRSQSVVLSLVEAPKTIDQVNSVIPPCDIDWTKTIVSDVLHLGLIERTTDGRYRLTLLARVLLECLEDIPVSVRENAWRLIWLPDGS